MTTTAKFIGLSLLCAMLVLLITAAFNYKANRWGIYAEDYETFHGRARPNRLWLKTKFLAEERPHIDCLLFGSSRVAAIDTRKLAGKCFNFNHPGGLLKNHLESLRYFVDSGLKLDRVYIGLDDISYHWDPKENELHLQRRSFPRDVSDWFKSQIFYLLQPIDLKAFAAVFGRSTPTLQPHQIIQPNDDWERIREESEVFLKQPEIQDQSFREMRGTIELDNYRGVQAVGHLKKIVELAKQNNIEVVVFFNPLHYKTYLARRYKRYLNFKGRVSKIIDFYDFTGLNRYSSSNVYWKETSHYSSFVGDQIAKRLTGSLASDSGFGRRVTNDKLDELERSQIEYDMQWLPGLIEKEGLMDIPARFVARWRRHGQLVSVPMRSPPGEENEYLIDGGEFTAERNEPDEKYRPGVWTRLNREGYFVLEYQLSSSADGRLLFKTRQDSSKYGLDWSTHLVRLRAGGNRGYLAGFSTRRNPAVRLQYDRRAISQKWRGLGLYQIEFEDAF